MIQVCSRLKLFLLLSCVILAGCMVGPDFKVPRPPPTKAYYTYGGPPPHKTSSTPAAGLAGKAQYFEIGKTLYPQWWTLFGSKAIDDLVLLALCHSPTLDAAIATLQQAQHTFQAQFGALLLPSVGVQWNAQRERFSTSSFGTNQVSLFNLYNASVNVAYTFDVFGGLRRQVEYYGAIVDYQRYQLVAAYLSLTANVVTAAITGASLEAQIKATQDLLNEEQKQLGILRKQFELGGIARQNVLTQETQVSNTRALIPLLKKNLAQTKDALAVFVGVAPSEIHFPKIDLYQLKLPSKVPVTLPSTLVQRRPDVKAAEAILHEASAQVGVATANLLPQFPITATYGYQSDILGSLFKQPNLVWSYGGGIAQALFKGGSLWAQRKAAIDAYHAAFYQYQQTVLQAFQNVADALSAGQWNADALNAKTQAEIAAKLNLKLITEQFNLGAVNYLALLIAEQQYQQALVARIQAESTRFTDTVALFVALGGSWWVPSCYPVPIAIKLDHMA